MFSPGFCKDVAKMLDWGCGTHNQGHFKCEPCSCKKKRQPKTTSAPRFHLDKGYNHIKSKTSKKKAYLKKDMILPTKRNVSFVERKVTGKMNFQIKRKIRDLLPCFQKTWIQHGEI